MILHVVCGYILDSEQLTIHRLTYRYLDVTKTWTKNSVEDKAALVIHVRHNYLVFAR